jgi:glycerophosphoryl diester phosphodiesterase
MEKALALGIDGLITDYPDRLRTVIQAKGMPVPAPTPVK